MLLCWVPRIAGFLLLGWKMDYHCCCWCHCYWYQLDKCMQWHCSLSPAPLCKQWTQCKMYPCWRDHQNILITRRQLLQENTVVYQGKLINSFINKEELILTRLTESRWRCICVMLCVHMFHVICEVPIWASSIVSRVKWSNSSCTHCPFHWPLEMVVLRAKVIWPNKHLL